MPLANRAEDAVAIVLTELARAIDDSSLVRHLSADYETELYER